MDVSSACIVLTGGYFLYDHWFDKSPEFLKIYKESINLWMKMELEENGLKGLRDEELNKWENCWKDDNTNKTEKPETQKNKNCKELFWRSEKFSWLYENLILKNKHKKKNLEKVILYLSEYLNISDMNWMIDEKLKN